MDSNSTIDWIMQYVGITKEDEECWKNEQTRKADYIEKLTLDVQKHGSGPSDNFKYNADTKKIKEEIKAYNLYHGLKTGSSLDWRTFLKLSKDEEYLLHDFHETMDAIEFTIEFIFDIFKVKLDFLDAAKVGHYGFKNHCVGGHIEPYTYYSKQIDKYECFIEILSLSKNTTHKKIEDTVLFLEKLNLAIPPKLKILRELKSAKKKEIKKTLTLLISNLFHINDKKILQDIVEQILSKNISKN